MRFVKHNQIDKTKWDTLIAQGSQPHLYMLSWYLDTTCLIWDAVIWGDYEAVLPLPTKHWWFFQKVYQPFFVQQTGLCWKQGFDYQSALKEAFNSKLLKKYFSFRIHFHSRIQIPNEFLKNNDWKLEIKKNHLLNIDGDYLSIYKGYNENRKRNLKKAKSLGWKVVTATNMDAAIKMYKENQAMKQKGLKDEIFNTLKDIFNKCDKRKMGELFACFDVEGNILSYAYFVHYHKRIYYLFGTMNSKGREHSAISLIFDSIIEKYASQELTLDFEGGNLESIGNYFASFGAIVEEYPCLQKKSQFIFS